MKKIYFFITLALAIISLTLMQSCNPPAKWTGVIQFDSTETKIVSYDWTQVTINGNFSIIPTNISNIFTSETGGQSQFNWAGDFDDTGRMLRVKITIDSLLSSFENHFKVKVIQSEIRSTKHQLYLFVNHQPAFDSTMQKLISINETISKENQSLKYEIKSIKKSQAQTNKLLKKLAKIIEEQK
ncbi:MAG: hypothetical protein WCG25_03685 [bacterium]